LANLSFHIFQKYPKPPRVRESETGRRENQGRKKQIMPFFVFARPGISCLLALSARFWEVWGAFRGFLGVWETFTLIFFFKDFINFANIVVCLKNKLKIVKRCKI
jgi:hypothetical protein